MDRGVRPIGRLVDEQHVVEMFHAPEAAHRADRLAQVLLGGVAPPEPGLELAVEDVVHQGALAGAGNAGDRGEGAKRDVAPARCAGCAGWRPRSGARGPAGRRALGTPIRFCPERYWPVSESCASLDGPGVDHLPAVFAGAGAELQHEVGAPDRGRVVLHDDDRVALSRKPAQQREQAIDVARVQPDRRLVEDVERIDQVGAERVGQRDALRLAAGEGAGQAVEA